MINVLVVSKSDQLRSDFNSYSEELVNHQFAHPTESETLNLKNFHFILVDKQSLGTPITDSLISESRRNAPESKIILLTSVDTLSERYNYLTRGVHLFLSGSFSPKRIYNILNKFSDPVTLPV